MTQVSRALRVLERPRGNVEEMGAGTMGLGTSEWELDLFMETQWVYQKNDERTLPDTMTNERLILMPRNSSLPPLLHKMISYLPGAILVTR